MPLGHEPFGREPLGHELEAEWLRVARAHRAPEVFGQDYADCTDQMDSSLETPLSGDPNA